MTGIVVENPIVDRVLDAHRDVLGADFKGYRNHIYRVVNFFNELGPGSFESTQALAVAAAFHDLGIWVDGTFDYLGPSASLAMRFIEQEHLENVDTWLVHELIVQHHKVRQYRMSPWASLVEQWRKADHVDVSFGLLNFGIQRHRVRLIQRSLPDCGFHACLLKLSLRELVRKPWNPLPMIRW